MSGNFFCLIFKNNGTTVGKSEWNEIKKNELAAFLNETSLSSIIWYAETTRFRNRNHKTTIVYVLLSCSNHIIPLPFGFIDSLNHAILLCM